MENMVEIFKALSDKNRLLIIDMLSCGELCGCEIIDGLNLTQPTVSHHMKILHQAGLVNSRKEGKWIHYSLNKDTFNKVNKFIEDISSYKDDCICKKVKKCNDKNKN